MGARAVPAASGVEDRLVRTDDRFRQGVRLARGRLHPLPDGFQLLAPTRSRPFVASALFSWPGKLRMALDLVLAARRRATTRAWAPSCAAGWAREALERVAQPLVAGIYTADPDELSASTATMPRFSSWSGASASSSSGSGARTAGRPLPGTSGARWSLFVTFQDGMEELVADARRRGCRRVRVCSSSA